jgi:cysteine desulfurase
LTSRTREPPATFLLSGHTEPACHKSFRPDGKSNPVQLMIYLDHNATTPLDERVLEVMMPYLTSFYGNPASLYRAGRLARGAVETAREQVAALVGAHPSQLIFTSGGTEANNLALKGLAAILPVGAVAVGATEHPSVLETAKALKKSGWSVRTIDVDPNGRIDPDKLHRIVSGNLRFASIMLANNETGVIQDVANLATILQAHNVLYHCDATQAAGKIAVDFSSCGAHLMSLSGHKLYGPKGVGALVIDRSVALEAVLSGGGQEKGLRGGTENVAAIVGFGRAAEIGLDEMEQRSRHLLMLRDRLERGLRAMPAVVVFAQQAERLPNTVQFGVNGMDGEMLLMEFDRRGIAISSGSACASGGREPSHVLLAVGIEPSLARSAIRVSLGAANTEQDVARFLAVLQELVPEPETAHAIDIG